MNLTQFFALSLTLILAENFVLAKFMGLCPFLGASRRVGTAAGMGAAVVFVTGASSAVSYGIDRFLLRPFGMEYLRIVVFVIVIASLVQAVELFLKRAAPALHTALGIYLPLIATNCAILATAIIASDQSMDFAGTVAYGLLASIGFALAIVLFAGIRERLEFSDHPRCFDGFPIALVSAGLLAMSFMGLSGMRF
jgi:electron transport complex protein RnfA